MGVTTGRSLAVVNPTNQARDDYDFYLSCPGKRDWWRIATTSAGEPVRFIVPAATPHARNVGYLGVRPAHRGRGLVDDLLAEVTHFHARRVRSASPPPPTSPTPRWLRPLTGPGTA